MAVIPIAIGIQNAPPFSIAIGTSNGLEPIPIAFGTRLTVLVFIQ